MSVVGTGIFDAPTEVLEKVLDFLHEDHAALYAASLVCRAWVPRSRYHLFSQTVLNERMVPDGGDFIETYVNSFLALSRSENCTIVHAIRRLILMITSQELLKDIIDSLVHCNAAPIQIVYNHINSASVSWNAQTFESVHDFTFNMERRAFDDAAWNLITSFPSLRTLALYTQSNTTITLPPDMPGSSFRALQTLRLRLVASEELLHYLQNLDGCHFALETFDLRMIRGYHRGWGPVNALNAFLKGVSDTLKHLSLGVDAEVLGLDRNSSNTGLPIDLSPLVHLSSLFLRNHDMGAVCDAVASLNSPILEVLTIQVLSWTADDFSPIKECDCNQTLLFKRFATIMGEKPLTGSKRLGINLDEGLDVGVVLDALKHCNAGGPTRLFCDPDDRFQENSMGSIAHLLPTHEL